MALLTRDGPGTPRPVQQADSRLLPASGRTSSEVDGNLRPASVPRWLPMMVSVLAHPYLPVCLALGLVAAQMSVLFAPGTGGMPLAVGVKVTLASWMALTVVGVGKDMIRGHATRPERSDEHADHMVSPHRGTVVERRAEPLLALSRLSALHIGLGALVLIAAALQRAPSRLAANVIGYVLVAVPALWVVQRRAGPAAAARAATVLALFALLPTHADLRDMRLFEQVPVSAGSFFRWSVGWPEEDWILRHEIRLERPGENRPMALIVQLAAPYEGPAQVFASMNGYELGPLRNLGRGQLQVTVPAEVVSGQSHLRFELRQRPVDPSLRLVAQRWTGGASLRSAASSFFDGQAWRPGTFNDLAGRPRIGIYLVELR